MIERIGSFYPILHVASVLLFLGHILRLRKNPSSTLAWFLFVLFQPFIALPLYVIFGSRKIKHFPPSPEVTFDHLEGLGQIERMTVSSGGRPPCFNDNLKLLGDSVFMYETLMHEIAEANERIFLETFIFADDEVSSEILKALTQRAREGLDVRIILDSLGSFVLGHPSFKEFKLAGGKFASFMPLFHRPFRGRINLRNHRKMMIFDRTRAITGGMNIAKEYIGPSPSDSRWIDMAIFIEGPLAQDLEDTFLKDWAFATGTAYVQDLKRNIFNVQNHQAQLVTSGPDMVSDPIYEWLLTAIYTARKRVWMTTPYFLPDESLIKAIELAGRRGLDVRVLIPERSNHFVADLGRKTYLTQIDAAGVKVLRLPRMIHAKVFIMDDNLGFIGSANLDARSLLINYEAGIALSSQSDIAQIEAWWHANLSYAQPGLPPSTIIDDWIGGIARLFSPVI